MTKEDLRQMIGYGDLDAVIRYLLAHSSDTAFPNTVVQLAHRFNNLKNKELRGIISQEDANLERNKITHDLLSILDGQKPGDNSIPAPPPRSQERMIFWLGLFAALAAITGYTLIDSFSKGPFGGASFPLIVFVHGPAGRQQIILENTGKIVLDLGSDRRTAQIGENGRTVFSEVPAKFAGQKTSLGLQADGYQLIQKDSQYALGAMPVYLAVQSSCRSCKIAGIVRSQVQFIAGAVVSTGQFAATTDTNGYFEINVPPSMEQSEYGMTVRINGKIVWDRFITPNPLQPAEILID